MGLNLIWLGTMWGTAIGILIADVIYFFTDSLTAFLLVLPCALIGRYLGRRGERKYRDMTRKIR